MTYISVGTRGRPWLSLERFNPDSGEMEAGRSHVKGLPGQFNEPLISKFKKRKKKVERGLVT